MAVTSPPIGNLEHPSTDDTDQHSVKSKHVFNSSDDERLQTVERIARSEAFQKSSRLPALLRYLAKCTLANDRAGLTEQAIGHGVFGKPKDFHPTEDSCVRVYARQLRLRLHEYYQAVGHDEQIIVEIPKGAYALAFHPRHAHHLSGDARSVDLRTGASNEKASTFRRSSNWLPWVLFAVALVLAVVGWYRSTRSAVRDLPPWPINQVLVSGQPTTMVLADGSYVLRLLGEREISLDEYADHHYSDALIPHNATEGELRLFHYLQSSQLSSMADVRAASAITSMAGILRRNIVIRSAKEINGKMLANGNVILIGANTSNPWEELYEDYLNFRLSGRYISNRSPQAGEQTVYSISGPTGFSGEDYATISLVPGVDAHGTVLLLQGLRLEGTEAAIRFLSSDESRRDLETKLKTANGGKLPRYFEALLHSHSMGGSPASIDCIAVRVVSPTKYQKEQVEHSH
ncbi:MAG TPA: hypothetical protein VFE38_11500 [Edaphobacter sp.]|nr:hypothetical protein [Edaphobacter sp.]